MALWLYNDLIIADSSNALVECTTCPFTCPTTDFRIVSYTDGSIDASSCDGCGNDEWFLPVWDGVFSYYSACAWISGYIGEDPQCDNCLSIDGKRLFRATLERSSDPCYFSCYIECGATLIAWRRPVINGIEGTYDIYGSNCIITPTAITIEAVP